MIAIRCDAWNAVELSLSVRLAGWPTFPWTSLPQSSKRVPLDKSEGSVKGKPILAVF